MAVCLQSRGCRVQTRHRLRPNSDESFVANFCRRWRIERGGAAHVVTMETADDMVVVADAKGIRQHAQRAVGHAALDPVAVILQ